MLPADEEAFSDALKAALPEIRFVSEDYWRQFLDHQREEEDRRERERRSKLNLPRLDVRRHMRDPTGESLRYWPSLADPAEKRFLAWIEPARWQPVWTAADSFGIRYIENPPRLWFEFQRSMFRPRWPRTCEFTYTEPVPGSARETLVLEGSTFEVRWNPAEPDAEAFGKKVYNVLRKVTVSRFITVEPASRRALTGEARGRVTQCLAGRHAAAWTLKRRHNYLMCDNSSELLKSAGYPFRPRETFTKAEYEQFWADREADFQARLQQLLEESKSEARARAKSGEPPVLNLLVDGIGGLSGLKMRIPIGKSPPRNGK